MKISKQILLSALCLITGSQMLSMANEMKGMPPAQTASESLDKPQTEKNVKISITYAGPTGPIAYGDNHQWVAQPQGLENSLNIAIPKKLENISVYLKDDSNCWLRFIIAIIPTNADSIESNEKPNNPPYASRANTIVKKDVLTEGLYVFVTVVDDTKHHNGRFFNINVATDTSLKPVATCSFFAPYKGDGEYYYNVSKISIRLNNQVSKDGYWVPNKQAKKGQKRSVFTDLSKIFFIQGSQKELMNAKPIGH